MSRFVRFSFAFLALVASSVPAISAELKLSGENTKIAFEGTKKDGKHVGTFPKLSGVFESSDDILKSKLTVKIDMDALESDDPKLTLHLKGPDFFETKKYAESEFVSKGFKENNGKYIITGNLTMHGKTKEITMPAAIVKKGDSIKLTSEFKINRSDWGITYGKGQIDEEVKLKVAVDLK